MNNIAIFVSGNGTNCENIINYFSTSGTCRIALVVSSNSGAYALTRARRHGIKTFIADKSYLQQGDDILDTLKQHNINYIVLAGFLLMIPPCLTEAFPYHIINIHPALLPKFGGKGMYGHHVHEAVKAAGETETGITIHFVNGKYDDGEIIAAFKTPISPSDTVADIEQKIHRLEQEHFPKVLEKVFNKQYKG